MMPHVEDLAAFLRAVDAEPAHLVGSSWGAFICLLTAIRHPELVRALALAEPPVLTLFTSADPRPSELLRLLVTRPRTAAAIVRFGTGVLIPATKAFEKDEDEKAMLTFAAGVLGGEPDAALGEERVQQARENRSTLKAALLGAGFPPLDDDEVRGVHSPTLLVNGSDSPPLFQRLTDRLEELLPRSERVEIAGTSHMMFEEDPTAFNDALSRFLPSPS